MLARAGDSGTARVPAAAGWTATGLWLEPGTYHLKAAGRWRSGLDTAGPDGDTSKWHLSGELFREVVGLGQALLREVAGNPDAALFGARREPGIPWMALVGVVPAHQDGHGTPESAPDQHELLGVEATITVAPGDAGYLYAFPNDAWGCYGNNDGAVELTAVRA